MGKLLGRLELELFTICQAIAILYANHIRQTEYSCKIPSPSPRVSKRGERGGEGDGSAEIAVI